MQRSSSRRGFSEKLGAAHPVHLLGFGYIKEKIVVTAPHCQMFHLVPVPLVVIVDELHRSCFMRKRGRC